MNFTLGTTFSEFKKDFYGKTKDLSLYDCGGINILKVVLDGLKVNYISRGRIRTPFFYPDLLWNAWQRLQALRRRPHAPAIDQMKKILVADLSGRCENEPGPGKKSFYFNRLMQQHEPGEVLHVIEYTRCKDYPHNLDLRNYLSLQYAPLTPYEKQLRKDLLATFNNIKHSALFSREELANIRIAIQSFFSQFKLWNELLRSFAGLRYALIEQHYHHEGLLLALKLKNIKAYEIQHGLIAESDIFYVFPKEVAAVKNKALFPDKIFVFGEYWKLVLAKGAEFAPADIVVTGDFRNKPEAIAPGREISEFKGQSKIILISSQTFMHAYYADYTAWLSQLITGKHPDWKIILKLHPNEKEERYASLAGLKNVLVTKNNINQLFRLADIHISVYSTTLFDALEHKLANFSLQLEGFEDYTLQIVKDRIALPLLRHEDPVEKQKSLRPETQLTEASFIYDDFGRHATLYKQLFLN